MSLSVMMTPFASKSTPDDDRRVDSRAVRQGNSGGAAILLPDFRDLGVEAELTACGLHSALHIVRGKLGVADIARIREKHSALDRTAGRLAKAGITQQFRRCEALEIEKGQLLVNFVRSPILPRYADDIESLAHRPQEIVRLDPQRAAAGIVIDGQAALVRHADIAGPVAPYEHALIGAGTAIDGRVMGADNRAGPAG